MARHARLVPLYTRLLAAASLALLVGCATVRSASTEPMHQAADDQLTRGEALYPANCQSCHGDARTGEGGLPGVPNHGPAGHTWHHSDPNLTEIILDGSGAMGEMMRDMMNVPPETPRMPAWRGTWSDEDIAAILTYIKAGWTPEQQRFQRETPMMQ